LAYLKKSERHDEILKVAMNMIAEESITSITARSVAEQAGIAVGQIHHHFKSIGQLKAQALIKVTDELVAQADRELAQQSVINKIISLVSPIEGKEGLVIRKLWNEAIFLAERDPDIKQACKQSTEEWHKTLVKLLEEAIAAKKIAENDADELAWRLIALSCGIDNLAIVDEFAFTKEAVKTHILQLLQLQNPPETTLAME
jgi:AcrR family transcriptional regulator